MAGCSTGEGSQTIDIPEDNSLSATTLQTERSAEDLRLVKSAPRSD